MKLKTIQLEDKENYAFIDQIKEKDVNYIYLSPVNELEDENIDNPIIIIRKLDKKEKYILGLDTEEEYKMALELFVRKGKNTIISKKVDINFN